METKSNPIMKLMIVAFASLMILVPSVLAYSLQYPAYDLYQVFVENVFGGFWLSVFAMGFIMWIMMSVIGGISIWTSMSYNVLFVYAMALGYTNMLFLLPIWTFIIFWSFSQILRLFNAPSSN